MFYCTPSMFYCTPSMCFLQDKVQEEESSKLKETYKTVPHLCFTVPHLCVYFRTKFKKKKVPNWRRPIKLYLIYVLMLRLSPIYVLLQDKVQEEESSKLKETYKTVPHLCFTVPHLCFTVPHLCVYFRTKFKKKKVPNWRRPIKLYLIYVLMLRLSPIYVFIAGQSSRRRKFQIVRDL